MIRLFFQLYLLIVVTLIGVGWGLEKLWQSYGNKASAEEKSLDNNLLLLEYQLRERAADQWSGPLDRIREITSLNIQVFELSEMWGESITRKLNRGGIAYMQSTGGDWLVLKKVAGSDKVIALRQQPLTGKRSALEWVFMLAFYAAIALVIMIWVWPLSRDLKKLEEATGRFGDHNWTFDIDIKPGAQLYPLVCAFKKMARRIEALINSHKDMSNAVSHEIKTPLARMKFELAMAENAESIPTLKDHLANIKDDIAEMNALTSATLDYAVLERADFALNLARHNFTEIVGAIVDHVENSDTRQVAVAYYYQEDAGDVICDIHLMERVVRNLLYNAIRHAEQEVRVTFNVNTTHYRLSVEDDGPGVPEQDRERVFNSFVRLSPSKPGHEGFGLGLAIVKRIVEWHGGAASVDTSLLGGARFVVTWPIDGRRPDN